MQLGRERARGNSSTLNFELYTLVLVIQIRTSLYLESNTTFKVNIRTYVHIGTICKGTVFPRVFTQWLRFYFWCFTLAHAIYI